MPRYIKEIQSSSYIIAKALSEMNARCKTGLPLSASCKVRHYVIQGKKASYTCYECDCGERFFDWPTYEELQAQMAEVGRKDTPKR